MATRFYLTTSEWTPEYDQRLFPATSPDWSFVGSSTRPFNLAVRRLHTEFYSLSNYPSGSIPYNVMCFQHVSQRLSTQVITGTVKGILRAKEAFSWSDLRAQICIRVVTGDCSLTKGVLLACDNTGPVSNEFDTAFMNRKFPVGWMGAGTALTPQDVEDGDRLIVEVGYRAFNTSVGNVEIGDFANTDCAENETDTDQYNPWIEFSQDLVFFDPYPKLCVTGEDLISELGTPGAVQKPQGRYASLQLADPSTTSIARGHVGLRPEPRVADLTVNLTPPTTTTYYKMRAQDSGASSPGYVTWVVTGSPDFAGAGYAGASPTPVGTMVPNSAVVAHTWQEEV